MEPAKARRGKAGATVTVSAKPELLLQGFRATSTWNSNLYQTGEANWNNSSTRQGGDKEPDTVLLLPCLASALPSSL